MGVCSYILLMFVANLWSMLHVDCQSGECAESASNDWQSIESTLDRDVWFRRLSTRAGGIPEENAENGMLDTKKGIALLKPIKC